jgi:hypothetical protein
VLLLEDFINLRFRFTIGAELRFTNGYRLKPHDVKEQRLDVLALVELEQAVFDFAE